MQIMYGNAHDSWYIGFQNWFQLVIVHASFFHFALYVFAKPAFCAVQITKGKLKLAVGIHIRVCGYVMRLAAYEFSVLEYHA